MMRAHGHISDPPTYLYQNVRKRIIQRRLGVDPGTGPGMYSAAGLLYFCSASFASRVGNAEFEGSSIIGIAHAVAAT